MDNTGNISPQRDAPHGAPDLSILLKSDPETLNISRQAASPALAGSDNGDQPNDRRHRPRTFPYDSLLPYDVEDEQQRDDALNLICEKLWLALKSNDIAPGVLCWTRELNAWLNLKFEMPRERRAELVRLYFELSLAPGIENTFADKFVRQVINLTRQMHYLKPTIDLTLPWKPIFREIKALVLSSELPPHQSTRRRSTKLIWRLITVCQPFFDPRERMAMLEEILPYFAASDMPNAYISAGCLASMLPNTFLDEPIEGMEPKDLFPTFFHLWSLVPRSKVFDIYFMDLLSAFARNYLKCHHVEFGAYGIFTQEQSDSMFTALLRIPEIPVGQAVSAYSQIDYHAGLGAYMERDQKKSPVSYHAARFIINSLSPKALDNENSVLSNLEGFIQSIDTFFHPSNSGGWSTFLGQFVHYLADLFVSRFNREQSGELEVPEDRRINDELKRRFVLSLRDVTFMGIFSKGSRLSSYYVSALQNMAYLCPELILPGALQRFYPSLQGLHEVHRTTASLQGFMSLVNIMIRTKGYRCHITALLSLAMPGIDANDLNKTSIALSLIHNIGYSIPIQPLEGPGEEYGIGLQWVQEQMELMGTQGTEFELNYEDMPDEEEKMILKSTTSVFRDFVLVLLDKVFTLLENLPDASTVRSGTPEESIINLLPAALWPVFASLSSELFDQALDKMFNFIYSQVVHQARDSVAWILSSLCRVNAHKVLKMFVPMLVTNIRNEIDVNNAASDRNSGSEILPRDRALVWYIAMLGQVSVYVGDELLKYQEEILGVIDYMQVKCRGLPTLHISNLLHHMICNLTSIYPNEFNLYEPEILKRGVTVDDWGKLTSPSDLTISWHVPSAEEITLAIRVFESQSKAAADRLMLLMSPETPIPRTGKNKEWSDEVDRLLSLIRMLLSGISPLFDPRRATKADIHRDDPMVINSEDEDSEDENQDDDDDDDDDLLAEFEGEDEEPRLLFQYNSGYLLNPESKEYIKIHALRDDIGRTLSRVHRFLTDHMEDDVSCFQTLYYVYRIWITDVGIERSARPLERQVRIYKTDIQGFRISGLRKQYPRPLLIKRAETYRLHRLRYGASIRQMGPLDKQLLLDLTESCLSVYADVRRIAQSAQDAALKSLTKAKPVIIPHIVERWKEAIKADDHPRIKGGMYTLFYTSLLNAIFKDWRYAPEIIKLYIATAGIDKPSIQTLGSNALYNFVEFGKRIRRLCEVDEKFLDPFKPSSDKSATIERRRNFIALRSSKIEESKIKLGLEMCEMARNAHWKIATRCTIFASNLCIRFDTLAPQEYLRLAVEGSNDPHPSLRSQYSVALCGLFQIIDMRATYDHNYHKYIQGDACDTGRVVMKVDAEDPEFTQKYLDSFSNPDDKYRIDADHPGWLVWGKSFVGHVADPKPFDNYDDLERQVRDFIGSMITRAWLKKCFDYMKQEPRDQNADRFRLNNSYLLMHVFDLMYYGRTAVKMGDVVELVQEVYEDGSDRNQHRATAEILAAMLSGSTDDPCEYRSKVWEFAAPMLLKILDQDLTPENLAYWTSCVHLIIDGKDPRRAHEIFEALSAFRLDLNSNAAFKEASKIRLIEILLATAGWHFRDQQGIMDDFVAHIDHPYKTVRESMGRALSYMSTSTYHESFKDVATLLKANKEDSSLGIRPYDASPVFGKMIDDVFLRLEAWRKIRTPGQQEQSSYTSGSKTVLTWMEAILSSQACTMLIPHFPKQFLDQFLYMMDVKEDPELMKSSYYVYLQLPNIPFRDGQDVDFIEALIRISTSSTMWHQRLRAILNIQVFYFRRLFLINSEQRDHIFNAISNMLQDSQLEVRQIAASTLAGMIRCSPMRIRDVVVEKLERRFRESLLKNPMPRRRARGTEPTAEATAKTNQQIVTRHAAVLGLGALIEAFPYVSPPPKWMPKTLALLATRAANDAGIVGKATKGILSDFKKTRQDSWMVDQKAFTSEQLEDLEGVLWKSYFA